MSKITLTDLVNLQNETTAVSAINNNNAVLETASDNTLSRNGTQPNSMGANLDMNSNRILNLPAPASNSEPARLQDLATLTGGGTIIVNPLPTGGVTGSVLSKNSPANFDASWTPLPGLPPIPISNVIGLQTALDQLNTGAFIITGIDKTGVTDVGAAINAALLAAPVGSVIILPTGKYLTSQTIIVPGGRTLQGITGGFGSGLYDSGTAIIGTLSLATVMTVDGGGGSFATNVRNINVTRAAGSIPAGTIGINIQNCNNTIIEGCLVSRHAIGLSSLNSNVGVKFNNCITTVISNTHVYLQNQSIEISFNNCRFGMNGAGDLACTAFVTVDKGLWDTLRFAQCQFNLGINTSSYGILFTNYDATNPNGICLIEGLHCEGPTVAFLGFAGNTARVSRITLSNSQVNIGSPFFGAGGSVTEFVASGCRLNSSDFTLDNQTNSTVTGCIIGGAFLMNIGSGVVVNSNRLLSTANLIGTASKSSFQCNSIAGALSNTSAGVLVLNNV